MTTLRTAPLAAALAAACALATGSPAASQPAAPDAPPVVFFWSSPSELDAAARAALIPAVEAAARPRGAPVVDLSPAAAPAPALAERVTRAITAYDAMRFGDALFELDQIVEAAAEHGARGLPRDALVDLFLYRGLARTETGDEAGAWSDFVRAATLDPARLLDPARFRPSAVKTFARAVEQVVARGTAPLTVTAPAGARVHIDGRPAGRGTVTEALLPGDHFLWVEHPAAPPVGRAFTLSGPLAIDIPDQPSAPPGDSELRRRAARLSAGPPLLVALRRDGGAAIVELRAIGRRGAVLRGAVRLAASPAASAGALEAAVSRELDRLSAAARAGRAATAAPPPAEARRWYHSRWLWVGVGAAAALLAVSPLLLDSSGEPAPIGAVVDTGALER